MAANPQLAPEFPKYTGEELAAFIADPMREEVLGITQYVVCRDCGEGRALITAQHLQRPGHTVRNGAEYRAKWKAAPLACIKKTLAQRTKMELAWKELSPQERVNWVNNAKNALNTPEGKKAISDGTKEAYKRPEVKQRQRAGLKEAWKNAPEERHLQASKRAKTILQNPEIIAKARAAHATPETSQRISEGNRLSFKNHPERGVHQSERSKQLWAERRAQLSRALPADASRKPDMWLIIAVMLLTAPLEAGNGLLASRLDENGVKCPFGKTGNTWGIYITTENGQEYVRKIRTWIGRSRKPKKVARLTSIHL